MGRREFENFVDGLIWGSHEIYSDCALIAIAYLSISPPRQHAARSEPRPHGGEQDQVALLQLAVFNRVADGQRYGRGRSVAVLVNVLDDLALVEADLVGGGVDDPQVGLVGDERADVGPGQVVSLQHRPAQLFHLAHGVLEDRLAVLVDVMHLPVHGLARGRVEAAAAGHIQMFSARAVDLMTVIEDAVGLLAFGARLKQNHARAVTEEDERRAVFGVQDAGHHVRADDQDLAMLAALDELRAGGQRVEERRAGGGDVEAPGSGRANLVLYQAGGRGEEHVGRDRRDNNQLDLMGLDAAPLQQVVYRLDRQLGRRRAFFDPVALVNARAPADPCGVGDYHLE